MARECGTASLASARYGNRTVRATGAAPFADDFASGASQLHYRQPSSRSQCPSLLSLPPSLVFESESTSVDEGDSIGPDTGNNAGETSVSENEVLPQGAWNITSATRSSENVDHLHTRHGAEEVVHTHTGGLYSVLPDADNLAFGPPSDLLTDMAMPASSAPPGDFGVVYAGVIDMSDAEVLAVEHQKYISPAMAMWLRDDSDFLKYKLSHGRRA
ncbi:hypothetical protein LTR27_007660 [Elasticomyces elasticus]|nr:hypothetical protein LTR27_007660 [Elasticomyces elasticus]